MINRADYQTIAVALREAKKELISRGLTDPGAQKAARVIEEHISLALLADNPRFDPKTFERATYPYPYQEGVEAARAERQAYADELDDGDFPRMPKAKAMPLDPRAIYFQHRVEGEYRK